MTKELQHLLRESAADAPAQPHSVAEIVHEAQRRHRRHVATLAGSALALVLVAGAGYAALTRPGADDARPADRPTPDVVVEVQGDGVVRVKDVDGVVEDSRRAKPGTDYEVVAEFPGYSDMGATGWDADDLVPSQDESSWELRSGQDGSVVGTVSPPEGVLPFLRYVGAGSAVWTGSEVVLVQDVSTGVVQELPVDLDGRTSVELVLGISGDRVWVTMPLKGSGGDDERVVTVASAPVDGSAGFRQEVEASSGFAAVGHGNLVWADRDTGALKVRDLSTGEEQQVADPRAEGCAWDPLGVSAEHVAAQQQCVGSGTVATTVFSLAGEGRVVLADIRAAEGGLSDRAVLFQSQAGQRLRTYAYVFESGEVLELSNARQEYDGAPSGFPVRASGDRLSFPSSKGLKQVVVALE